MADSLWSVMSSVGTVAAVIVALGVSVRTDLVIRRADKDRSELAAAKMLTPISDLERRTSFLWGQFLLEDVEPADGYVKILLVINELGAMARAISIDDLYPLLRLERHAAKRSARALGLLESFTADAGAVIGHHSWADVARRKANYERWVVMLSEIRDHLGVAVSVCEAAASTGAPRPTAEEIHG